jgi:hypothetical protein
VAEHDDRVARVNLIVFPGVEHPAQRRLDAEHGEVVAGHHFRLEPLGSIVDADRRGDQAAAEHFGQRFGALLQVLVDRIGVHPPSHVAAVVDAFLIEHHQLVRGGHGQLPEQDLIDQRENRGVGADSQREREDRDRGEERVPSEAAEREAKIGKYRGHAGCLDGIGGR